MYLVDEDPSARNGLARLLRTAGYDVRAFASGGEFFEVVDPETSGCLVLDAGMPGLSGEDLQSELKARGPHLPVIVVSADDDPGNRGKAAELNAVGFFRKPVDGTALLDAVNWALRSHRAEARHEKA